ncbi:MAG: septum formation initiator family protein [Bacteroidetes bacterium]|nr:septum formation initiator family protein [Bacteroidota bacterium]
MLKRIPSFLKNKYLLASVFFIAWMAFFDSNNIFSQLKLTSELNELYEKKTFYKSKIKKVTATKEELLNDKEALEKFAREKYWMKRDNEDIYIVVE